MRMIYMPNFLVRMSQYTAIFLILEANSKTPNDFSLIGRKPNETSQLK